MAGETITRGIASLPVGVSGTTRRTRQDAARRLVALSPSNILYNPAGTEDTRDLRRIDGDGTQGAPTRSLEGSPCGQHHVCDFQAQAQPAEASPDAAEEPAAGALREPAPLVSVHSPVAAAGRASPQALGSGRVGFFILPNVFLPRADAAPAGVPRIQLLTACWSLSLIGLVPRQRLPGSRWPASRKVIELWRSEQGQQLQC